jgi:hypothetical protein
MSRSAMRNGIAIPNGGMSHCLCVPHGVSIDRDKTILQGSGLCRRIIISCFDFHYGFNAIAFLPVIVIAPSDLLGTDGWEGHLF